MEKKIGRPKLLSDEIIAEIYRLYDETEYGYLKIGMLLGLAPMRVRYWIKRREALKQAEE